MANNQPRPIVLIILDGFGYREEEEHNAIAAAVTPTWDYLWQHYPHLLIEGSGRFVGLPEGQMGNSEVGHLNMGAGRIVNQDLTRIDLDIESGKFFKNEILREEIKKTAQHGKAVHVFGLVSPGGVHSHENHLKALIQLASEAGCHKLYIHAFLDGRDTPPKSALTSLDAIQSFCDSLNTGKIVSIVGRYYAMDRDKRWERIQLAYNLLTNGAAMHYADNVHHALQAAYLRDETDEFVKPTVITNNEKRPITINDDDTIIFMNFRADRARELTTAFINESFTGFARERTPRLNAFITLTQYDKHFANKVKVAYPPLEVKDILAECVSRAGLKQLRIAETEKYAHVTFFFNGGIELPFPGEDRMLIPSPKVSTYDLQPEMSANELTEKLVQEIIHQRYDLIICNFANPDMVGHSGNFDATVKAIETIDQCLGRIIDALKKVAGEVIITADHGNAEQMYDAVTKQPHTAHTTDPVPFIYVGRPATLTQQAGKLSDIAPTLLYLLGLPKPSAMTGQSLLKLK